jgi:carbon monoxide dehydrogenase subunit G
MKFTKQADVNASADKVWKVFAHDFDNAHVWMASVPHSYAKTNGEEFEGAQSAGRVCELDSKPGSMQASERFLAYDEAKKTCTVRIDFVNPPFLFPIIHNTLEFSVVETGKGRSHMKWDFESRIKPLAYVIWPLIRIGFGVFVGQIAQELKHYLENDAPHPRKVKALAKAKL